MKMILAFGLGALMLVGSTAAFACDGQGADTTNTSSQPKKKDAAKKDATKDKKDAAPTRS